MPRRTRPVSSSSALSSAARPIDSAKPRMSPSRGTNEVEQLRQRQHRDRDHHRRAHVLPGVEPGREDLDADQAHQADTVALQRHHGLVHIARREGAVVVERGDHRPREHESRPPRTAASTATRRRPQSSRPSRCPWMLPPAPPRAAATGPRQRHAEQRGRELHQPVGVGQPRHGADADVRRDLGVDQQAKAAPPRRPPAPAASWPAPAAPGWRQAPRSADGAMPRRGIIPMRRNAGTCIADCSSAADRTPAASA